jgi:hypothetical protein
VGQELVRLGVGVGYWGQYQMGMIQGQRRTRPHSSTDRKELPWEILEKCRWARAVDEEKQIADGLFNAQLGYHGHTTDGQVDEE